MGKILYLECNSGISGDMTVGALLDLGADRDVLIKALDSLGVDGYRLHFGRTKKCGLDAYDFDVLLEEEHEHRVEHGHEHETGHEHIHGEDHGHNHNHEHSAGHGFANNHSHDHRNLTDIYTIIDRLDSETHVKDMAKRMFDVVAEAESKAHGIPVEEVHFHEVGAIDSIVDIISAAVCIHNLGLEEIVVSPLAGEGLFPSQELKRPLEARKPQGAYLFRPHLSSKSSPVHAEVLLDAAHLAFASSDVKILEVYPDGSFDLRGNGKVRLTIEVLPGDGLGATPLMQEELELEVQLERYVPTTSMSDTSSLETTSFVPLPSEESVESEAAWRWTSYILTIAVPLLMLALVLYLVSRKK